MQLTKAEIDDIDHSDFLSERFRRRMLGEKQVNEYRHHGHSIRVVGKRGPDDLMTRLFTIADWICKMVDNRSNFKVHMTCWLYPDRKYMPKAGGAFQPRHLNSGMTVHPSQHIYIWRKEEIEKVFIHELIHALQLDRYWWNQTSSPGRVFAHGGGKLAEAWTETMAVFYYQVFLRYCGIHTKYDETIQKDEIRHNQQTCNRMLQHFGYRSIKELHQDGGARWLEDTNAWAYYIGRQMIMSTPYFWQSIGRHGLCQWTPTMIRQCMQQIDLAKLGRKVVKGSRSKWILASSRAI